MLSTPFEIIPQSNIRTRHYQAGELVFRLGETPHSIFFILSGSVQLQRYSKTGDLIIVHRAFSNEYFAEASLFADEYHCDAFVSENATIAAVSKPVITELMNVDQNFASGVTAYFARQVQDLRRLLELRSIRSAKDRVYTGLQEGLHKGNIMSFASVLGLTHEVTYRALNELVKQGYLIKLGRGRYRIKE
jgi:CRP-like cAMP-binding protein